MKIFTLAIFLLFFTTFSFAQNDSIPFFKGGLKTSRDRIAANNVKSIKTELQTPLTDDTAEEWIDAFNTMEFIGYKEPWVNEKIKLAFTFANNSSYDFKRSLVEMVYANYTTEFKDEVNEIFLTTIDAKLFAMCAEYLLRADKTKLNRDKIRDIAFKTANANFKDDPASSFIAYELLWNITQTADKKNTQIQFTSVPLLNKEYLKGNTIVYSFQRKNRNYPGIVIVRGADGSFVKTNNKQFFYVPQLARSISGLPAYITNGNTPQGIFRMDGFDVSKSVAIGPTTNIQLLMPMETNIRYFLKDSTITDSVWTEELYAKLLPESLKKYHPLYQSYFASGCGRTEIIAHGTTVDPEYYKGQPYYPLTPTEGCLATKEIWDGITGKRSVSDQQKLVDAVKKAGGADGYYIVIELDDQEKPVSIDEILPLLKSVK